MILALRDAKHSNYEIGSRIGRAESTVSSFLKRFKNRGSIENHASPGRPRKTTPRMDRTIVRMVKSDRRVTTKDIASELGPSVDISTRTIRRRINEAGYVGGP